MGIQSLLKVLDPALQPCRIEQFKGKTLAIDGYTWLHRGYGG